MIKKKDLQTLSFLRKNARHNLLQISKEIGIPSSTLYDRMRLYNKKYVKKHSTLLNWKALGLHSQSLFIITCDINQKHNVLDYLKANANINSLHSTHYCSDFIAETVFRDIAQTEQFRAELMQVDGITKVNVFNFVEEIKKEDFLTDEAHFEKL